MNTSPKVRMKSVFKFKKFLKGMHKKSSLKINEQKIIYILWASCFFCVLLIIYVGDHLLDIPTKLVPMGVVFSEKKIKM